MRLVIAEKPAVAQSIAAVLGAKSRHDGYLEGSGYICLLYTSDVYKRQGLAGGKCWTGSRKPASALYPAQMKLRYEKLL